MTQPTGANNGEAAASIKESHCDVLIIGAGPAGLMAANWLAVQGLGASVRIIDKRSDKIFTGQADGLQCRTLEILHSFGLGEDIWRQSNRMIEMRFWNPGADGQLQRTGSVPDTIPGISRWQQCVLHQGRIEKAFLDSIDSHSDGKLAVERAVLPESLSIDERAVDDPDAYPVTVEVRKLSEEEATPTQMGKSVPNGLFRSSLAPDDTPSGAAAAGTGDRERIHAKYMIGCDGAHSWTRRQMGSKMEGDQTSFIWGVLDAVPITNFPDVRNRCAIHSVDSGSMMIIPREDGLVRFYIQVSELNRGVDRHSITPEMILATAKAIIAPYTLDIGEGDLDWWTAYVIGQRTADRFALHDRVFIAGDACHTHSPKAGQGMNTSMQDTYNLAWKVAAAVKGVSPRSVLATYEMERKQIAQDLITFDHRFSRLFSGKPAKDEADAAGISMAEFQDAFLKGNRFASGLSVDYQRSLLTVKPESSSKTTVEGGEVVAHAAVVAPADGVASDPSLSAEEAGETRIDVGKRFNTAQVVCHATALPYELADWILSDGRWRIVYFCGDIRDSTCAREMQQLGDYLSSGLLPRFTPSEQDADSVIDVLTVAATPRAECELADFHQALRPHTTKHHRKTSDGRYNTSQDYHKVFVDDTTYHQGHGRAYEKYGVATQFGTLVVIRPDGYVSLLMRANDHTQLGAFFEKVLLPAASHRSHQHTRIKRTTPALMLAPQPKAQVPQKKDRRSTLDLAHSLKNTQENAAPGAAISLSAANVASMDPPHEQQALPPTRALSETRSSEPESSRKDLDPWCSGDQSGTSEPSSGADPDHMCGRFRDVKLELTARGAGGWREACQMGSGKAATALGLEHPRSAAYFATDVRMEPDTTVKSEGARYRQHEFNSLSSDHTPSHVAHRTAGAGKSKPNHSLDESLTAQPSSMVIGWREPAVRMDAPFATSVEVGANQDARDAKGRGVAGRRCSATAHERCTCSPPAASLCRTANVRGGPKQQQQHLENRRSFHERPTTADAVQTAAQSDERQCGRGCGASRPVGSSDTRDEAQRSGRPAGLAALFLA